MWVGGLRRSLGGWAAHLEGRQWRNVGSQGAPPLEGRCKAGERRAQEDVGEAKPGEGQLQGAELGGGKRGGNVDEALR